MINITPHNDKNQAHGKWVYFNDKTGKLSFTTTFKNGIENGVRTFYRPDGTISSITNIVNGVRNGYEIVFNLYYNYDTNQSYSHKAYHIR